MPFHRHRITDFLINSLFHMGVFDTMRLLNPNTLTVLNYHRIEDPYRDKFDTFKPNVSATPSSFARQMDYIRDKYNVIGCVELAAWLRGEGKIPPHAALITFDDGYYDNFINAYPILKSRSLPAIIFLTTNFIGRKVPFYWDFVAACFFYTQKDHAHLPLLGTIFWTDEASREKIMYQWIEIIKRLPEEEKRKIIESTDEILDVVVPLSSFSDLHLSWHQVREMNDHGIDFGSHTVTHPILTRIPLESVKVELERSKERIEDEIDNSVIGIAYPNGGKSDFSHEIIKVANEVGYELAFTLLPGPTSYSAVRRKPLEIRRIFLSYLDSFPVFVSKLSGGTRILNR